MPQPLTDREFTVLVLLADGSSNDEIARELFIGIDTVKCHVRHVAEKLNARNRTHAVALAYHCGLLLVKERAA